MKNEMHLIFVIVLSSLIYGANAQTTVTIIEDDIESYIADSLIGPQSPLWTTWGGIDGAPDDVPVTTAYAASGTQSVAFVQELEDALFLLGDSTTGVYTLSFKLYVPSGKQAYYNIQRYETPGVEWAHEVYFYNTGFGSLSAGLMDIATFPYPTDTWFDVVQEINMDDDITELKINGLSVYTWPFSYTSLSTLGFISLGAIDFFTVDATYEYYVDDLKLTTIVPDPPAPDSIELSITVDAFELPAVSSAGMHIAGSFQGWDPAGSPMTDNGDSTWSITVTLPEFDTITYKFINGTTFTEEETVPMDCGVANGVGGYDRQFIASGDSLQSIETVCFSACDTCDRTPQVVSMSIPLVAVEELLFAPNPATGSFGFESSGQGMLEVYSMQGIQIVAAREIFAGERVAVDCSEWSSGTYLVAVHSAGKRYQGMIQVTK